MQQYELHTNDPSSNRHCCLMLLPPDLLQLLERHSSENPSITFTKSQAIVKLSSNKQYTFKIFPEKKSDVDLYRFSNDNNTFEQVGVVQNKLMVEGLSMNDAFAEKIRRETEEKNRKDKEISVISPGTKKYGGHSSGSSSGNSGSVRRRVVPTTGSNASGNSSSSSNSSSNNSVNMLNHQKPPPKASFDASVLQKLRQKQASDESLQQSTTNNSSSSSSSGALTRKSTTTTGKRKVSTPPSISTTTSTTTAIQAPPPQKKQRANNESDSNSDGYVSNRSDDEDQFARGGTTSSGRKSTNSNNGSSSNSTNGGSSKQRHAFYNIPVRSLFAEFEELSNVDFTQLKPDLDKYKKDIETPEQYRELRKAYEEKYKLYSLIFDRLKKNTELFNDMYHQYQKLADTQEKENLFEKMKQLYKLRRSQTSLLSEKYKCLHEELGEIKANVSRFVRNMD